MKTKSTILTREEQAALVLSARRLTNKEIAERLGVSVIKVKTSIHGACLKLGAHTRVEALNFAFWRGEIRPDEAYTWDEMAEVLATVGPDVLTEIAQLERQRLKGRTLRIKDKHIPYRGKKPDAILAQGERDVLILVGRGLTNKEIADRLNISVSTVRNTLNNAFTKLGARSRGDAFVLACQQREVNLGEAYSFDEMLQFLAPLGPESLDAMAQLLRLKLELARHRSSRLIELYISYDNTPK